MMTQQIDIYDYKSSRIISTIRITAINNCDNIYTRVLNQGDSPLGENFVFARGEFCI